MARPEKEPTERRDRDLTIPVTEMERDCIKAGARATGMDMAPGLAKSCFLPQSVNWQRLAEQNPINKWFVVDREPQVAVTFAHRRTVAASAVFLMTRSGIEPEPVRL